MTILLAEALLLHPWPLNVRALYNVLSIATIASPKASPLDLHPEVVAALDAARAGGPEPVPQKPTGIPEVELLEQVLVRTGGNVREAAQQLGCSRQQLYRWLEAKGLELERFRQR
jgi:DNA-binding NtrC family response regulator